MAEKEGGVNAMENLLLLLGGLAVLVALWLVNGGAHRADLRGIFLHPPPPLNSGGAYGPELDSPYIQGPSQTNQ